MVAAESSSSSVAEALTYTLCLSSEKTRKLAIFSLFSGRDLFVWLPTGFRKSICFQMLPLMFDRQHTRLGSISKNIKPGSQYIVNIPSQPEAVNFSIGSVSIYSSVSSILVQVVRVTLRCE